MEEDEISKNQRLTLSLCCYRDIINGLRVEEERRGSEEEIHTVYEWASSSGQHFMAKKTCTTEKKKNNQLRRF